MEKSREEIRKLKLLLRHNDDHNEEYKKEIRQWEAMYKEWMTMMESRVSNIDRTHQILQVLFYL